MLNNFKNGQCYIIAEIGGNFRNFSEAKKLVDLAKDCGVDAVKLQTYKADTIASREAIFDMENTGVVSQFDVFKQFEIDEPLHKQIFEYCQNSDLDWFSTPSHQSDVDLLERCGVAAHKIGSDDAVNHQFLRYVARTNKTIILSTGMCTLSEVRESVDVILSEGNSDICLLHAITSYPTHEVDVNLSCIKTLKAEFPMIRVGYSDHTLDPVAALCSVAMGAEILERHFTHDKNADGPDHMLSSDPVEMKWLVDSIRRYEIMLGNGIKMPAMSENGTRLNNRKSVVAKKMVKKGMRLNEENLCVKRPGTGVPPKFIEQLYGRVAKEDIEADRIIKWSDLE